MTSPEESEYELPDLAYTEEVFHYNDTIAPYPQISTKESEVQVERAVIDYDENDPFVYYKDPFVLSPEIIAAVQCNNVEQLKSLLNAGECVNLSDFHGNTPLHLSVLEDKQQAFDYLVNLEIIRVDTQDFNGVTPLLQATINNNEYYALKLIEKGANVNMARDRFTGYTPLHYAAANNCVISQALVEKGAYLNIRDNVGETPLYLACERGNITSIYILLYHGADATVPNCDGNLPFTLSLQKCSIELQEILFNYTFDETSKIPVSLRTFELAMVANSPLLHKMIERTSQVIYDDYDLQRFCDALPKIRNVQLLGNFMVKFDYILGDMIDQFNVLNNYITYFRSRYNEKLNVDFFYLLCGSEFIGKAIGKYEQQRDLIHYLINRRHPPDETSITKLVCCLLSYGIDMTVHDLNCVYENYRSCELLEIMLHMELIDDDDPQVFMEYLMPNLIYNVNLNIDICLADPDKYFWFDELGMLLKYFVDHRITEYYLEAPKTFLYPPELILLHKLPKVPSLVQLTREAARKHIVKKYDIRKSVHFFTVLKWLPINQIYKDILSYKKEIYNFSSSFMSILDKPE